MMFWKGQGMGSLSPAKQGLQIPGKFFTMEVYAGDLPPLGHLARLELFQSTLPVDADEQAIGCERAGPAAIWPPVIFDVSFILKEGRYLPKIGRELIRLAAVTTSSADQEPIAEP